MEITVLAAATFAFLAGTAICSWAFLNKDADKRRTIKRSRLSGAQNEASREFKACLFGNIPFISKARQKQQEKQNHKSYCVELPRMLEVVALGMRSGLGFDQAFALYVYRFDTLLAQTCKKKFDIWERGLIHREQGLKELSEEIDLPIFTRFCTMSSRALKYGASMNALLIDLASESRKAYRAEQQALVAKAPVKMLLPTGALILPAMLLLVLGPILLDLAERMI